jgi:hypothetical protein
MSRTPRCSPSASVLIERKVQGQIDLSTAYLGSSLKSGRAFARALLSAQADPLAQRVLYLELVHMQIVIQVSVPILHETLPPLPSGDPF